MSLPAKPLASCYFVTGVALLVIAATTAWGGYVRWSAANSLEKALELSLAGNDAGAREAAREAAELLPHEPAAWLPATDLQVPANADALMMLAHGASGSVRSSLIAAAGVALGRLPGELEPDSTDRAMLQAIAARAPGQIISDKDHPPHRVVLAAWAAMRLSAAWAAGHRNDVYEAASALLTLAPRHPQARELGLLTVSLSPNEPTSAAVTSASDAVSDASTRERLISQLQDLAPERAALRGVIPGSKDVMSREQAILARMVASGRLRPTSVNEGLVIRCLQAGQAGMADELVAAQEGPRKTELGALGDLLDGNAFATSEPGVTPPLAIGGYLTFHLSTPTGAIPTRPIFARFDDIEIGPDQIQRIGTLVLIPIRVAGKHDVSIRYDSRTVYAASLNL